jgi:hypothetical protein
MTMIIITTHQQSAKLRTTENTHVGDGIHASEISVVKVQ